MQLMHRVALNGNWLDEADDRIIINRIETGDGKTNISAVSLPEDGSRVTAMSRDSLDITVKFCIRLRKRNMADREEVLEKVNAWAAAGGTLTVNYKENRKIKVFCAQPAVHGDPWEWTKEYSIVFRACGVPYWQAQTPETATEQDTSHAYISIDVDGSAESVLEATFLNTSGSTVDTFSLNTGDSSMSFAGLGLANGETLAIDHNDNGKKNVLRLRIRSTGGVYRSVLNKRTGSDDLYVKPGSRTVEMTAGGNGTITVSSCGRFA